MTSAKEIYGKAVRLLPPAERLKLAELIIRDMAHDSHLEQLSVGNRQRYFTDEMTLPARPNPEEAMALHEDLG